ncbi:MAG: hypothetical protein ACOYMR_13440 [Ilumatobacteraceae bacterium]
MNPDEHLERLRSIDPMRGASVEPHTGPRAAALMEQIMQTDPTVTPTEPAGTATSAVPARPRRRLFAALGAAGVVAVGAFAFIALRGDDGGTPTSVSFAVGAPDITAMCLPVSEQQPTAEASAFRGTVVSIENGIVTLDVATWYQNGTADQVLLTTDGLPSAALDGVDFQQGGDYLITAGDGQVGTCGVSGPYSAELEQWFQTWYS